MDRSTAADDGPTAPGTPPGPQARTVLAAALAALAGVIGVVATGDDDGKGAATTTTAPVCHRSDDGTLWQLVAADDFDGVAPDADRWRVYDSVGNAGFGLRRPSAVTVGDGRLVITAAMVDGELVSGGVAHRFDQVHGRWEATVRADPDPSSATSAVVLTWPRSENWPVDGEIDIYETGPLPHRAAVHSFVHYGEDNHHVELSRTVDGTTWHDVAMEWTRDAIRFYLDGSLTGAVTRPEAIPRVPHHLTLQLDAWADTMGAPVRMEVDRIRVFAPVATCAGG